MKELLKLYFKALCDFPDTRLEPQNIYEAEPLIDGNLLKLPKDKRLPAALAHGAWMLENMPEEELVSRFNRWLGFVQCLMWLSGNFSLTELRDQTRKLED